MSAPLRRYLDVPRRRWRLVAGVFALVCGAAVTAALVLPRRYLSATLILVEHETVPEAVAPGVVPEDRARQLLTLRQQLLSRTRLETVLRELDPYPAERAHLPLSAVVDHLRTAVRLTVKGNDAFTVEYQHHDPAMAMRVTDRLARLFIDESNRAHDEQAAAASQFIDTELRQAREELAAKEAAVGDYKEKHIGTLPEQTATNLATLQRLQQEQQAVSTALQAALDRISALEVARARVPVDEPATELAALEADLAALRGRYTEEHPDVVAARRRLEEARRRRAAASGRHDAAGAPEDAAGGAGELEQARQEAARLRERGRALDQRIAQMQAQVEQAPKVEQELGTLTRDLDKLNENYASLMSKKMDARMARKLDERWKGERFRILDPAYLPDRPSFPSLPLFALAGVVAGLVAGVGAAFLIEDLDRTVKRKEDLAAVLPFPVIGVIGRIDPPPAKDAPPLVTEAV